MTSRGTIRLNVSTVATCQWQLSDLPGWLSASALSGTGAADVDLTLSPNPLLISRSADLTLGNRRVTFSQQGLCTAASASLSPPGAPIAGGTIHLNIVAYDACDWNFNYNAYGGWFTPSVSAGTGAATVPITVSPNSGTARSGNLSFQFTHGASSYLALYQAASPVTTHKPRAVVRNSSGDFELYTYGSNTSTRIAGAFARAFATSQDDNGNVHIVAIDQYGALYVTAFNPTQGTWGSWNGLGGVFKGTPAILTFDGKSLIAGQDTYDGYWTAVFDPTSGFSNILRLGGIFESDPVIARGRSDYFPAFHILGRDKWNSFWEVNLSLDYRLSSWIHIGGIFQGQPSAAVGTDGYTYVAGRDLWGSLWMARLDNLSVLSWTHLGGIVSTDPQVVALREGTIAVAALAPGGAAWFASTTEGPTAAPFSWTRIGGVLQDFGAASYSNSLYLAGRDSWDNLWWYRHSNAQWTFVGGNSQLRGPVLTTP